jgi:hypothetical protein
MTAPPTRRRTRKPVGIEPDAVLAALESAIRERWWVLCSLRRTSRHHPGNTIFIRGAMETRWQLRALLAIRRAGRRHRKDGYVT